MKMREPWYDQGKALPYSASIKIQHCGSDASAHLSNTERGVRLHCHRCGETCFERHDTRSVAEILAARRRQEDAAFVQPRPNALKGPQDWPAEARVFVLRAGLRPEVCHYEYGFGWSGAANRLCIPVRSGEQVRGSLYRAVFGERPKYILAKGSGRLSDYGKGKAVFTEDAISAIKVSRAGFHGIAVLGTSLQFDQLSEVQQLVQGKSAFVWTDPDGAGEKARHRLASKLGMLGIQAHHIRSEHDPKAHSLDYIKGALNA